MTYQQIIVEPYLEGGLCITLNRPKSCNALSSVLIAELTQALQAIADKLPKLVVLQAAGSHFCAGACLEDMQAMGQASWQENINNAKALSTMLELLAALPVPVIASVQGACYGGGLGLVAASDVVIASDEAKFCLPEVKLGLAPAVISPYVVAALGVRQAKRYMLSGAVMSAQKALELSLVHELATTNSLDSCVQEHAQQLIGHGFVAQQEIKSLLTRLSSARVSSEELCQLISTLRASPDAQERLATFFKT